MGMAVKMPSASPGPPPDAAPTPPAPRFDPRTRALLEGPIVSTLLRLATPNVLVMFMQAAVGLIDVGSRYLYAVGPFYGLFGLGLALYIASQGAGRLLWPLLANLVRLGIAAGGGWLALR